MDIFDYQSNHHSFEFKLIKSGRQWRQHHVSFPTALPTSYPELGTAYGEYYEPVRKDAPLVILLHGMGNHSVIPCRALAAALVRQGIAAFVPYLPVHTRRMNADMKQRYPKFTDAEWLELYRVSVINIRQIIDWAQARAVNKQRIGLLGISYGGFISAITMGIDRRVDSSVLIVTGGNSLKISQASLKWGAHRGYGLPEDEYRQAIASYEEFLGEVARQGLENVTPPRNSFLTDPLTYSSRLKYRPLYFINARWDEAVPREATLDLWQAAGKPEITWLPAAHASIWLYYPLIRRRVGRFFRQSLHHDRAPTEK
ncbi:MAG: alpha/beta fold hydrolase [Dehalococcoidales bacterium]|nr:alpha/beta fold hydrolase [Dehalococcoidales bacterium]